MRAIVPVHEIRHRVPEQGRIRMGAKVATSGVDKNGKPKTRPVKLKRLRFTSADRQAIDAIAAKYGGEVTPWQDGPTDGLYQVTVNTAKIPIVLPPDPLSGTPIYEHWSGGGCLRRCDGLNCTLPLADNAAPDAAPAVVECPCRAENRMICKPKTRLNVVLREIPFGGTWRLESTGWNAAEELPGMVDMVMRVQEIGMVMGELGIEERKRIVRGQTKKFVVPALSLPESIDALAAGEMRLHALGKVREIATDTLGMSRPELNAGAPEADEDDWVVDAEIVDDEDGGEAGSLPTGTGSPTDSAPPPHSEGGEPGPATQPPPSPAKRGVQAPKVKALHAALRDALALEEIDVDVDTLRHGLVRLVTKGRSESSAEMTDLEQSEALSLVADLLAGDRRYLGVTEGRLRVSARKEDA